MTSRGDIARVKVLAADIAALLNSVGPPKTDKSFSEARIAELVSDAGERMARAKNAAERIHISDEIMADMHVQAVNCLNATLRSLAGRIETLTSKHPPAPMLAALNLLAQRLRVVDGNVIALARSGDPFFVVNALGEGPAGECQHVTAMVTSFEQSLRDSRRWWGRPRDYVVAFVVGLIVGLILIPIGLWANNAWWDENAAVESIGRTDREAVPSADSSKQRASESTSNLVTDRAGNSVSR